jgi:hypothetical protein
MNWLERARREILENAQTSTANSAVRSPEIQKSGLDSTANTAVRNPSAVTAVPVPGFCEKYEGAEEGSFDRLPDLPETPEPPPSGTVNATSGAPLPAADPAEASPADPPPPARPRGWSAADWRLFHNDRLLVAELALGKMPAQARTYAYTCCIREWLRVRPGASEAQAIAALAEKGITDPSPPPPPPPPARHLSPSPAGVGGAGTAATDVAGSTHIIAAAAGVGTDITGSAVPAMGIAGPEAGTT